MVDNGNSVDRAGLGVTGANTKQGGMLARNEGKAGGKSKDVQESRFAVLIVEG